MNFISTEGMTNENAPAKKVLVQYLEPFFGSFKVVFAIAYFDNPSDYEDEEGRGWLLWHNDREINVLCYCELPKEIETTYTQIEQKDWGEIMGERFPNLGNIGINPQQVCGIVHKGKLISKVPKDIDFSAIKDKLKDLLK